MLPQKLKKIREKVLAGTRKRAVSAAATQPGATHNVTQKGGTGKDGTGSETYHSGKAGDRGEDAALEFLTGQGLRCVERNWRAAGRYGTEIDLIMQDGETLVFVEVKLRKSTQYGGAAGSIDWRKQQKIIRAAQQYIQRFGAIPPACRFDTVLIHAAAYTADRQQQNRKKSQPYRADMERADAERADIEWLRAAFSVQQ